MCNRLAVKPVTQSFVSEKEMEEASFGVGLSLK